MKLANARSGVFLLFASLLQACGGGGDDNGGGGIVDPPDPPPDPPTASLSVSRSTVSISSTPGEPNQIENVTLTISNPPDDELHFVVTHSDSGGIGTTDIFQLSPTEASLAISFRAAGSLLNDTYSDSITVRACIDPQCASEIEGSPAMITTSYEVSGTGIATVTLDRSEIEVNAGSGEPVSRTETARVSLSTAPAIVGLLAEQSSARIEFIDFRSVSATDTLVDLRFAAASELGVGTFTDTVTVTVCYDPDCVRQIEGSPLTIETTFRVNNVVDPGVTPLEVESRAALAHDIVDAEFSAALNSIVTVGSYPANALYVYDIATGTEQSQLLNKVPTSVSVAPDGLTAAVGHDALISVVDLAAVGPGAPSPILLTVSADVFDLVLDGFGSVHAFPRVDQWVQPHSIHIATNTEQLGSFPLRAGSRARLHPSGNFIYTADNGLSPSDIQKWDITTGVATLLYDSPYHGDYAMCGDFWFSEDGSTLYVKCANTFRLSSEQAEDMLYSGAITLSASGFTGHRIEFLSQAAAHHEIALIEDDCDFSGGGPCNSHLAFYESDFLNFLAKYPFGPVNVNGTDYEQRGLYVYHEPFGSKKYVISKLDGVPDPDAEYYVSVIP